MTPTCLLYGTRMSSHLYQVKNTCFIENPGDIRTSMDLWIMTGSMDNDRIQWPPVDHPTVPEEFQNWVHIISCLSVTF